jgi:hypothetical protein
LVLFWKLSFKIYFFYICLQSSSSAENGFFEFYLHHFRKILKRCFDRIILTAELSFLLEVESLGSSLYCSFLKCSMQENFLVFFLILIWKIWIERYSVEQAIEFLCHHLSFEIQDFRMSLNNRILAPKVSGIHPKPLSL